MLDSFKSALNQSEKVEGYKTFQYTSETKNILLILSSIFLFQKYSEHLWLYATHNKHRIQHFSLSVSISEKSTLT